MRRRSNNMKRCFSCFKEFNESLSVCPYCGHVEITKAEEPIYLAPGTMLANRYIVGEVVGAGGFGIVYKAWDTKLETIVAVKEFFISRLVTRAEGLKNVIISKNSKDEFDYRKERFLAEAKNMAKFGSHRSIPNVFEFFEENNTAYIVMELLRGMALNDYLNQMGGKIDVDFAIVIATEVGKALSSLHAENIIHRDVAPDNIFICTGKEIKIKLMDLGAAKLADSTDDVIDIILKPGYSPPEQYDNTKNIGPWTDIYALGATLYMMLTGVKPDESTNRKISDELVPVNELNPAVSENLSNTVMKAMAVERHMRFKNVDDFLRALSGERKVMPLSKEKKVRKLKQFLGIMAACIVVAVVSAVTFKIYSSQKANEYLEAADITVWVIREHDQNDILKTICENNFKMQEGNEKVTVTVVSFTQEEYESRLKEALESDSGGKPDLYESTGVSEDITDSDAEPLDAVISSSEFKSCELLKKNYNKIYNTKKRMPLAVNLPVAYMFGKSYTDQYFYDISDFSAQNVKSDIGMSDLITKNFGNIEMCDFSEISQADDLSGTVLVSSIEMLNPITALNYRNEKFSFKCVYPEKDPLFCEFTYEWSISDRTSQAEKKAAEKLLRYMLNNDYLSKLCSDKIPVSVDAFNSAKFGAVADIYPNFTFEEE